MPKVSVLSEIPANETIYATLLPDGKDTYYITAGPGRVEYRLYKKVKGGVSFLGKARTPDVLENKFIRYGPETDIETSEEENDIVVTPFEMREHENRRLDISLPPSDEPAESEEAG